MCRLVPVLPLRYFVYLFICRWQKEDVNGSRPQSKHTNDSLHLHRQFLNTYHDYDFGYSMHVHVHVHSPSGRIAGNMYAETNSFHVPLETSLHIVSSNVCERVCLGDCVSGGVYDCLGADLMSLQMQIERRGSVTAHWLVC